MGYMRVLERSFVEHIWHAIHLSYLQFFSKPLDTGRYDRRFHTRLETLRSGSTSISGFPTGSHPPTNVATGLFPSSSPSFILSVGYDKYKGSDHAMMSHGRSPGKPGARANCAPGHMHPCMHRKFSRWARFTICTRAGALG